MNVHVETFNLSETTRFFDEPSKGEEIVAATVKDSVSGVDHKICLARNEEGAQMTITDKNGEEVAAPVQTYNPYDAQHAVTQALEATANEREYVKTETVLSYGDCGDSCKYMAVEGNKKDEVILKVEETSLLLTKESVFKDDMNDGGDFRGAANKVTTIEANVNQIDSNVLAKFPNADTLALGNKVEKIAADVTKETGEEPQPNTIRKVIIDHESPLLHQSAEQLKETLENASLDNTRVYVDNNKNLESLNLKETVQKEIKEIAE